MTFFLLAGQYKRGYLVTLNNVIVEVINMLDAPLVRRAMPLIRNQDHADSE